MKVIVGLGNPGEQYASTRHNIGFIILDNFARQLEEQWTLESKFDSIIAKGHNSILVKPQTYMNESGTPVQKILNFYKLGPSDLFVIHDDVDLPFGTIKIAKNSQAAGHNGVKDIINKLGTQEFTRLRFGVGRPTARKFEVADYVLANFTKEELDFVSKFDINPYL